MPLTALSGRQPPCPAMPASAPRIIADPVSQRVPPQAALVSFGRPPPDNRLTMQSHPALVLKWITGGGVGTCREEQF